MDEVGGGGEVGTDVELGKVVGRHPQVAHAAAVEVRAALAVEASVGGVQHVGDAQLPELKAVICCGPGGRREGAGCWLSHGVPEGSFVRPPAYFRGMEPLGPKGRGKGPSKLELDPQLTGPPSALVVGREVIFSPSLLPEVLCPCWLGQKEKGLPHPWDGAPRPSCPRPSHMLLPSTGLCLIPASTLQMSRGDNFPDSP